MLVIPDNPDKMTAMITESKILRWGLMTLTTVGYDYNPETLLGKILGGCCALSGVGPIKLSFFLFLNKTN